ncbi:MAG: altronate hydrolase [Saprospiraceae bacterium]|jgi:altronate hydrolase
MTKNILKVHRADNVIVALKPLKKGDEISYGDRIIKIQEDIDAKHKFVESDMHVGDHITMYGVLVGQVIKGIKQGSRISVDNIKHLSSEYQVLERNLSWEKPDVAAFEQRNFMGYHRKDGRVGTMNYWLVIPLVFCENRNITVIQDAMSEQLGYASKRQFHVDTQRLINDYNNGVDVDTLLETDIILDQVAITSKRVFKNVDGIKFLKHDGGCGGTRQDSETLCRLLAGYIAHPNVAGATVLSLGCQNAQIQLLHDSIDIVAPNHGKPIYILEQQNSKSERDLIATAVKQTFVGLIGANEIERRPAPLSKLCIGLECGGSDGFSGITANPSLGYTSDLLVALGGTTILSEFPELNGVEQELINRCVNEESAFKFSNLMKAYSKRAEEVGSGFAFNPSPGNIKDGLITDAIKSAGAAKKGGTSPVTDVLDYTEQATKPGLNLLCTPGNDVESTTGMAGSGANIIVFTTGLGTPTGNPVAPTIKVSTNNILAERMSDLIDLNAGTIITGEDTIESKGRELLELIIKVASGEVTPKAMALGQDDFIPWKRGIAL